MRWREARTVDVSAIVMVVVVTALIFDFTNGFHDTANAMATSIATGALRPRVAVAVAGVLNLAGAFLSVQVAKTISGGLVDEVRITPAVVFAGLVGAILWNLLTWLLGLPSSSSHALFGGLIGRGHGGIRQLVVGPYVSLQAAGLPAILAGILQALITLTLLGVIIYFFSRWKVSRSEGNKDDGRMDLRFGLLAAGMLLATPYSLSYDTPLLMLAVVPLLARIWCRGWTAMELDRF